MRATSRTSIVLAVTTVVLFESGITAHRRDELLQAARIAIEPDRVEFGLDLTPGIAVADAIIADIDRNRDGRLSSEEQTDYARQVVGAIYVDVDGCPLRAAPVSSTFADLDAFRRGEGTIHVQAAVVLPRLADGDHELVFRNTHRIDSSVYLANAVVPESDRVAITAQRRDTEQRDLIVAYVVRPWVPGVPVWLFFAVATLAAFAFAGRTRQA